MIRRVSNIVVTVNDAGATADNYCRLFGLKKIMDRPSREAGIERDILLEITEDMTLEITQPLDSPEASPMRRFLNKRGEGLFSFSVVVDDVDEATKELESKGAQVWKFMSDEENKFYTGFVHPKATSGVSIEMVTEKMVQTWMSKYQQ